MNPISIREATSEDVLSIVQLWIEAVDYAAKLDTYYARSDDGHLVFEEFIRGHLEFDTAVVAVGEKDKIIVGYCLGVQLERPPMAKERDYGVIYDMGVNQHNRRQGIGKRLFEFVKTWFNSRNITHIELNVLIANHSARKFWISLGFHPTIELLTLTK